MFPWPRSSAALADCLRLSGGKPGWALRCSLAWRFPGVIVAFCLAFPDGKDSGLLPLSVCGTCVSGEELRAARGWIADLETELAGADLVGNAGGAGYHLGPGSGYPGLAC